MIEIKAIKLGNGFFINLTDRGSLPYLLNGGMKKQKTHSSDWSFVPRKINKIERTIKGERINERFELKNPEMVSDHIPLVMPHDEVICCDCGSFCSCKWSDDYSHLESLYEYKYELAEDKLEVEEFKWGEISSSNINFEYKKFQINCEEKRFSNEPKYSNIADKILYPDVFMSEVECELSPKRWFSIIRKYIKANIDKRYAHISSDYDFCLEVKRSLYNPNITINDIIKGEKPMDSITIFECTGEGYQRYTQLKTMKGKNYNDLMDKVNKDLEKLIKHINKPIKECECCKGLGWVDI